ncbi:MAG: Di-sulfide bridge nucleocytoplasmic transport domain-containing protein [Benjaminiella poitrasii]|nr:MAG: Di-sulfide bridge nucleocytoplasmic transport domain-containing protein [Benjaminiella poitrasii]
MSSINRPLKRRRVEDSNTMLYSKIKKYVIQRVQFLATLDAPIILSSYARVLFHSIGILIVLFVVIKLVQSFGFEINARYRLQLEESMEKARICHQNYVNHHCGPELKGAIWQSFCDEWDRCRNYRASMEGKTKIAAQVFGELMNGFVEPLSLKAMVNIRGYLHIYPI